MSKLLIVQVNDHLINVGDISTVAPFTEASFTTGERAGVKITFMSKATSVFIPGFTASTFMDKLVESAAKFELPD